jgi:uncharacterized repeat protein (TIGR03803 family)
LAATPVLALALMALQPAEAQIFTVLYTFQGGADGGTPLATPLEYNGYLVGTTIGGGVHGNGTVFALNFTTLKETVLHPFMGQPDGADPIGGLVQDSSGNFYGAAYRGGAENFGTLFEVTPKGVFTLLHSFSNPASGGSGPAGTLVRDPKGDLFGTTYVGGPNTGRGTVFEFSGGNLTTLKNFAPGGVLPRAGLLLEGGKLYGTTTGDDNELSAGAVYEVGLAAPLYSFTGGLDGGQPLGSLIGDTQGNLYGTASAGGSASFGLGNGVIFKVNITTGAETVLHTFTGPDGAVPAAALSVDSQGNMYGTTTLGGAHGYGTVFELDASGNFTTLYSFEGGTDGATPYAGVVVDAAGRLWGAASTGGSSAAPGGYGTLFVITPAPK